MQHKHDVNSCYAVLFGEYQQGVFFPQTILSLQLVESMSGEPTEGWLYFALCT
jgi:hypothetical protein